MMHFSCDVCSKDLDPGPGGRYVVRVEAYPAADPVDLTDADLAADHVGELAEQLARGDAPEGPGGKKLRFDLCRSCYERFLADPLGREKAEFDFSEN